MQIKCNSNEQPRSEQGLEVNTPAEGPERPQLSPSKTKAVIQRWGRTGRTLNPNSSFHFLFHYYNITPKNNLLKWFPFSFPFYQYNPLLSQKEGGLGTLGISEGADKGCCGGNFRNSQINAQALAQTRGLEYSPAVVLRHLKGRALGTTNTCV